jgi:signal transduction histidine kinase
MIMVSNALKATKTAVWIKVNSDSDLIAIQVLNDGEQIDPPDLEKLFKPMTQLDISLLANLKVLAWACIRLNKLP